MADFFLDVRIDAQASYTKIQEDIKQLEELINGNPPKIQLGIALNNGATAQLSSQLAAVDNAITGKSSAEIKLLSTNTKEYFNALKQVQTTLNQVTTSQNNWTAAKSGQTSGEYAALSEYANQLRTLQTELTNGSMSVTEFNSRLAEIRSGVTAASGAIKAAGENTQTFAYRMKTLFGKIGTWFNITQIIMAAYRALREMVTAVTDLDTAMTELKKVTDETDAVYDRFLTNATTRAKKLGATLSDVVTATADFARLGFDIGDAENLADAAIIYKNVGDGIEDISVASESIIATMQAFGVSADEAMTIVDKFNEVGNNYAISSVGVGEALLRSAAAMNSANNTLDETIALATAANTIVQDPEKVGTTLKTVSMYLRASKTEAEEAGVATDGMANSISELRNEILALTGNKVDIQLDEDTYKSTYQIIKELSEVWGELSDISQANILELAGGKRNSNVLAAILENFTVAEKALETSANSAGSALAENEKYLESIEGRVSQFKATFEEFSQNFIDGELVKGIVDFGSSLVGVINSITQFVNACGELKTVLLAITSVLMITNAAWVANTAAMIGNLVVTKLTAAISAVRSVISGIPTLIAKAVAGWYMYAQGTITASAAMQASIPVIGMVLAAITVLVAAISAYNKSTEETSQDLSQIKSELSGVEDELETSSDRLAEIRERMDEINSLGEISITDQEELDLLEKESAELETQIAILERKKQLLEDSENQKQKELWNDLSSENNYRDNGEQYEEGFTGFLQHVGDYMDTEGHMSAVEYTDSLIDSRLATLEYMKAIEEDIRAGTVSDSDLEYYEQLEAELERIDAELAEMLPLFEECGEYGYEMYYKIILGTADADERLSILKGHLATLFADNEEITPEKVLKMYGAEGYEELTAIINTLISLGDIDPSDGTLDADSIEPIINDMDELEQQTEETTEAVHGLSDALSSLDKMSGIGNAINSIVSGLEKGESINYDDISELASVLEEYGISYDDYIQRILAANGDAEAVKEVLGDITNEIIDNAIAAGELTEADEELLACWLESIGVANAASIAHDKLGVDKEAVTRAETLLTNATEDNIDEVYAEIAAMMSEQGATQATRQELFELAYTKLMVNNNQIVTSSDIEQLIALANAAGVTAASLENLSRAKSFYAEAERYEEIASTLPDGRGKDEALRAAASNRQLGDNALNMPIEYESINPDDFIFEPSGGGGGGGADAELEEWNRLVEEQKHLLAMDKITKDEYYTWLAENYKKHISNTEEHADEIQAIEEELYEWEKERCKIAYDDERKDLDHRLAMNLITEEQYLIELTALYNKYYKDNDLYADEAMEAEEELYELRVELIEKWSQAAADAIEAMTEATEESIESIKQLIDDSIDAHEENFNLEKSLLDHALSMNYISEEEYYDSLEKLYKSYFKDKNLYTEQYWENQEEVYQHEQQMLEDSASSIEDIHAKVVEMIRKELESAIEAIEKTKEKYLDLIEVRREALSDMKSEQDYEKERSEQLSTISELQRQLNALAYDTSAAGVAKYKEVYAELQEAQKRLEEMESDRAYEVMNDQLDDEQKSIEIKYDAQISEYQDLSDNNEYLVDEAWARLNDKNSDLYNQLIEYNKKYSTSIKDDVTGSWETATKALSEYKDAKEAYESINNQIGQSGMTTEEYEEFLKIVGGKQTYNWASTALNFGASMLETGAGLMESMMGIAGDLIGGPMGSLLKIGSGTIGAFSGLGSTILKVIGGFASGTNHVPKTGWYRTNELGDEINLVKDSSGNEYRLLTEGSKVINAQSTARLMSIIKNPELLADSVRSGMFAGGKTAGSISSIVNSSIKEVTVSPVFQIQSSDPQGVAAEIKKMIPEIAKQTIKSMLNGVNNLGTKQKVQHLY